MLAISYIVITSLQDTRGHRKLSRVVDPGERDDNDRSPLGAIAAGLAELAVPNDVRARRRGYTRRGRLNPT